MAGWQELRRAIRNRDTDGVDRIWGTLMEDAGPDPSTFIEAAELMGRQSGGRRQAGVMLTVLVDAYKAKEQWASLLPIYAGIARQGPDDGSLRDGAIEAARKAAADRPDLEALIELSGIPTAGTEPEPQIQLLARLLELQVGKYVYHRSGWGVGKLVEVDPEAGRCVIDFKDREGHEMQLAAAARLVDPLEEDDMRVQAVVDPRGLRARAKEEPLELLRQALKRYSYAVKLKNVKEVLVPDAVAPSRWSTWWKECKKLALIDPRFVVGPGRDPKVEFHDVARADLDAQIDQALKRSPTELARQNALRELAGVLKDRPESLEKLAARAELEFGRARRSADRVGWLLVLSELTGENPVDRIAQALSEATTPTEVVAGIDDDTTRRLAGEGLLRSSEQGPDQVFEIALQDDAVLAEVGAKGWKGTDHLQRLLEHIDKKPATVPNLYAWWLKGQRRDRWKHEIADPYKHALRVLKVVDAVAYRTRRKTSPRDRKAVSALCECLQAKNCTIVREAAEKIDEDRARHLAVVISQSRAFTPRLQEKLQDIVLRLHPMALRDRRAKLQEHDEDEPPATGELYMTETGLQRLRDELRQLTEEEIPTNRKEIARAREFGDLKENAEYHAAREKQGMLEAKSRQIESDVARAKIIQPDIVRTDAVSVGSRVAVRDADGSTQTYTLLGPPDADLSKGILNYQTPLARALMGRRPGESVRLKIADAVREVEILSIENGLA